MLGFPASHVFLFGGVQCSVSVLEKFENSNISQRDLKDLILHTDRKDVEMATSRSCESTSCLNKSRSSAAVVEKMSKQPLDTRFRKKKTNQVASGLILPQMLPKSAHVYFPICKKKFRQIAMSEQSQLPHFFTNCKAITSR